MTPLEWKRAVIDRDAGCVVHHDCEGRLQAHHVVTQQHLRKRDLDCAWDRRIGVTVCERAHGRHHSAHERIPYDALPSEVVSFVGELGLDWYLERYYADAPIPELQEDLALATGRARRRSWEQRGGFVR
jgi:hypothetical protein